MTNEEAKKRLEVWLICVNCPEDKMCYDSHLHSTCEYTDYCDEVSIEEAIKVAIEVLKRKPCEDVIIDKHYWKGFNAGIRTEKFRESKRQEPCDDAISRQAVLDIVTEQERLASDRVRDTPLSLGNGLHTYVNPAYTKYSAQLSERSQFKTMIQTMPPVNPQEPKIGHWEWVQNKDAGGAEMTRNAQDIIDDMRNIVKPRIEKMLLEANFEGCGKEDKAEFETEFEMLLTLAEKALEQEPCSNCCNGNQIEKAKLCQKSYLAGMEHKQEQCADAISRQAVLKMAYDMSEIDGEDFTEPCMVVDVEDIQKLPPVTPQPKTGHWIDDGQYAEGHSEHACRCSKCGYTYIGYTDKYKECPNCGSKMESEET